MASDARGSNARGSAPILAGVVLVLVAGLAISEIQASCGSAFFIPSPGPIRIEGSCGYCGKTQATVPNFTPSARVDFWSLGTGDPEIGLGDDRGAYVVGLRRGNGAPAELPYDYTTNKSLADSFSEGPFYNIDVSFNTNWGAHRDIDGCVTNAGSFGETCTCVLIEDQWRGVGYFSLLSDRSDDKGDFLFTREGVTLVPVPRPIVLASKERAGGADLTVTVPAPGAGLQLDPDCPCGPVGFRLYRRALPEGTAALDRARAVWDRVADTTPFRESVEAPVDGELGAAISLAASLVFADGFEAELLSADAEPDVRELPPPAPPAATETPGTKAGADGTAADAANDATPRSSRTGGKPSGTTPVWVWIGLGMILGFALGLIVKIAF